jgi:hypothetical protein
MQQIEINMTVERNVDGVYTIYDLKIPVEVEGPGGDDKSEPRYPAHGFCPRGLIVSSKGGPAGQGIGDWIDLTENEQRSCEHEALEHAFDEEEQPCLD